MHMRHLPYNESTTRAQDIFQILRHDFAQAPPQTLQPLITLQTQAPQQSVVVGLMR